MPHTILLVDDEKEIVAQFRKALEMRGFKVVPAYSGEKAWQLFKKIAFDVVVVDNKMGKISGMDLLRNIDSISPFTKVIMITAFGDDSIELQARRLNVYDYLEKPMKNLTLVQKVEEACSRKDRMISALQLWIELNPNKAKTPIRVKIKGQRKRGQTGPATGTLYAMKEGITRRGKLEVIVEKTTDLIMENAEILKAVRETSNTDSKDKCEYDVFLCYNKTDVDHVRNIAKLLILCGILPWFDEWHLTPGCSWIEEVEAQLDRAKSAAIFVGDKELGGWQRAELNVFLDKCRHTGLTVIPVILPSCKSKPNLPTFLRNKQFIDFRNFNAEPLAKLIWGITGKKIEFP